MSNQPFIYRLPVRFADVDHAGIVYYPVFFSYFHIAFEEFFRQRFGTRSYVKLLDDERIGFPAVAADCNYQSPLRFGDTIEIEMSAGHLGNKSATFRYRVFRCPDEDRSDRRLSAEGTTTCAVVDLRAFRAVAIPKRIRELFMEIAESSGAESGV